jgi:uncharacterized delta-60 repeat protein
MALVLKDDNKKLTIQQMDSNLKYLESIGIGDINYSSNNNILSIEKPSIGTIETVLSSYNLDIEETINTGTTFYKNTQYDIFENESTSIILKNVDNQPLTISQNDNESITLDCNYGLFTKANGSSFNNSISSIEQQPDGKILVGGQFTSYNGTIANRIIRLNSDGTIDGTFNIGSGFDSDVFTIALQPDGKILAGGYFSTYNGTIANRIIRLNSDGTIDGTFNIGAGFDLPVFTIALQPDGKILLGGNFTSYNGTSSNKIIRLNSDGTIDGTFNIGNGFDNTLLSITLQPDGKILVGGYFTTYNGITRNRIIRLNSDGTIDITFNIGDGAIFGQVQTIKTQSDGKILVGGDFQFFNNFLYYSPKIVRLNSDGSVDNTFNIGSGFNSTVWSIITQLNGKILVGGYFSSYNGTIANRIIRLNSDGTIDGTFNIGSGFGFNDVVRTIAPQQPDGKILLGGNFTSYNGASSNRIIRLKPDSGIDSTFNLTNNLIFNFNNIKLIKKSNRNYDPNFNYNQGSFNSSVYAIQIQPDGKILAGGIFSTYNGTIANKIIRLNSDGSIDNTFNIGTGFDGDVNTITLQPDGKILAGGWFTSYNGTIANRIIRLNSDGTIDGTFNIGSGFNGGVNTIALQSDGKILAGGYFTLYDGTFRNYIIRLNSDGTIDNTFIGNFNQGVFLIKLQPDGKILVGGLFTSYNGVSSNRIIRLNSDGTIDNTFNIGDGFNSTLLSITLQPDGKILVGGAFTNYNGTFRNYIIRLNSDGTIDNTFNIGNGFNDAVFSIQTQPDGKILVGGDFNSYDGTTANKIIRLNPDGTIDNTFNIGSGFNSTVWSIITQLNGKILVGGIFTTFNNRNVNYFTIFNGDGSFAETSLNKFFINQISTLNSNYLTATLSQIDEIIALEFPKPVNRSIITYKIIKTK